MPVSQFCWEEGKTWENGYYLLSAVAEAISSIMAKLEMAKNVHIWKCENFLSLDMKNILLFGLNWALKNTFLALFKKLYFPFIFLCDISFTAAENEKFVIVSKQRQTCNNFVLLDGFLNFICLRHFSEGKNY